MSLCSRCSDFSSSCVLWKECVRIRTGTIATVGAIKSSTPGTGKFRPVRIQLSTISFAPAAREITRPQAASIMMDKVISDPWTFDRYRVFIFSVVLKGSRVSGIMSNGATASSPHQRDAKKRSCLLQSCSCHWNT